MRWSEDGDGFPPRRTFIIQKNNDSIPFQVNLLGCVLHLLLPLIKIPRSEEMVLGPSTKMKFTIPLLATWSSLSLECLQVGAVQEFTYLHCYYNSSVCWTRHPAIQQNSYLADWLTDIVSLCCHCHIHRCGTAAKYTGDWSGTMRYIEGGPGSKGEARKNYNRRNWSTHVMNCNCVWP